MATPKSKAHTALLNTHTVASFVETVGFLVAVVLQATGHHSDALVSALVGATCHAHNH